MSAAKTDLKNMFASLESRIQNLIHIQSELQVEIGNLEKRNAVLMKDLDEERSKNGRLEEGYRNLKAVEEHSNHQRILKMKSRINEIIVEIDKNVSMIDTNK